MSVTLAFLAWAAASLAINAWYYGLNGSELFFSALYLVRWVECFAFFYAAREVVVANSEDAARLVKVLVIGVAAFCLFGFIQSLFLPNFALLLNADARPYIDFDPQEHRLVSSFLDPNIAAGYVLLFGVIAFSLYVEGLRKWVWGLAVLFLALLMTLSRGGLLGFGIGILLVLFRTNRSSRKRAYSLLIPTLLVMAIAYAISSADIQQLDKLGVTDDSAMMRLARWNFGLNIVKERPIVGVGFNTLGFVFERMGIDQRGAGAFGFEGDLIVILALTGVIGLALYLNIYRIVFRNAIRSALQSPDQFKRALARGTGAATFGLLVSSCFSQIILFPAIMACMWTLWGIMEAQSCSDRTMKPSRISIAMGAVS
jgi:O-antigen ligase